jgi:hypothetical protein
VELGLHRQALFIIVISTRSEVLADEVAEGAARGFDLEGGSILVHHTMPEDFILMLLDEAVVERVYRGSRPFHCPRFSFQFKKWSRFVHASTATLSSIVDVELRGIPTHAWERSTAEQLPRESCWVLDLHPDMVAKRDLSSFLLWAWCSAPDRIHPKMELLIPELLQLIVEGPLDKRALNYSIKITAIPVALSLMVEV